MDLFKKPEKNFFMNAIKRRLRSLFEQACVLLCIHKLFFFLNQKKILILMYHGISKYPMKVECWTQLPYSKFEWQINYLAKHYSILSLNEVIARIKNNELLENNIAIITFDDGFNNNYTNAFPLLKEKRLQATICLSTNYIGTNNLIWADNLYVELNNTRSQSLNLVDKGLENYSIDFPEAKAMCLRKIVAHLKRVSTKEKQNLIQTIKERLVKPDNCFEEMSEFLLMNWNSVKEMLASGLIDFGAHTANHEILTNLTEEELEFEINSSCDTLKSYINPKFLTFAYPNGEANDFSDSSKELLKINNVQCALTTISGLNTYHEDLFELKRIGIGSDISNSQFKLRCSGFFIWLKGLLNHDRK